MGDVKLAAMTPAWILAIPAHEPERLFTVPDQIAAEYRILAKRFHPDLPGGDTGAFAHLAELHADAR